MFKKLLQHRSTKRTSFLSADRLAKRRTLRRLLAGVEPLEDRRLLACVGSSPFVVDTLVDESDGNFSTGDCSFREALELATANGPGTDTINFSNSIAGGTIELEDGELRLVSSAIINGNGVTIDADQESRILNVLPDVPLDDGSVQPATHQLTLRDLTLINGETDVPSDSATFVFNNRGNGGAIRFNSTGKLILDNTNVRDSRTLGESASGGGISAGGDVELINGSEITGNSTGSHFDPTATLLAGPIGALLTHFLQDTGDFARGGGIFSAGSVTLDDNSKVLENRTLGGGAPGGGIWASSNVTLSGGSEVRDNYTDGKNSYGGGIYAGGFIGNPLFVPDGSEPAYTAGTGTVRLEGGSLVDGNHTGLRRSVGGGIRGITVEITQGSTVSNNWTEAIQSDGGGVYAVGGLAVTDSTMSGNHTLGGTSIGEALGCYWGVFFARNIASDFLPLGKVASIAYGLYGVASSVAKSFGLSLDTNPCPDFGNGSVGGAARALDIQITNSDISNNFTDGEGAEGGALFSRGKVNAEDSYFFGNHTKKVFGRGGAIGAEGDVTLTNSRFANNYTLARDSFGGAVNAPFVEAINSEFEFNRTDGNGSVGGALHVDYAVIHSSTFVGNYTTGASANGGAVRASKNINVYGSLLKDNSTRGGKRVAQPIGSTGGALNAKSVFIDSTTFDSNYTTGNEAHGGAIDAQAVSVHRSTFFGNHVDDSNANGGAIHAGTTAFGGIDGDVVLTQSTLTDNIAGNRGGGVFTTEKLDLAGSIVLGNAATNGGGEINSVTLDRSGENIVGNLAGDVVFTTASGIAFIDSTTGIVFQSGGFLSDELGPVAGSPNATVGLTGVPFERIVQTVPLRDADFNPALDQLTENGEPGGSGDADQRGFSGAFDDPDVLNKGGIIDVGAFELQPFTVVTTSELVESGKVSLPQAIAAANATSNVEETITFAPELAGEEIQLVSELLITDAVHIDASTLDSQVTIRGRAGLPTDPARQRIFNFTDPTGDLTINNLTLTGGREVNDNSGPSDSTNSGGAIRFASTGTLRLTQASLTSNATLGEFAQGGAIFALGDVISTDSSFSSNTTEGDNADGGAIFALGTVSATDSSFRSSTTAGFDADGGAIAADTVNIYESELKDNSTDGLIASGGAIFANSVTLDRTRVTDNHTGGLSSPGGGIHAVSLSADLSEVDENRTLGVGSPGGGIHAADLTLDRTIVLGNFTANSGSSGGGISSTGMAAIRNSFILNNDTLGTSSLGGGIFANDLIATSTMVVKNTTAGANSVGGGIHAANLEMTSGTVSGNSVGSTGTDFGGLSTGVATITDSIILGNFANGGSNHEIGNGTSFGGNNIIGGIGSANSSQAYVESVFKEAAQLVPGVYHGAITFSSLYAIAAEINPFGPAANGSLSPKAIFSFQNNFEDGFGSNDGLPSTPSLSTSEDGFAGDALALTGDGTEYVELTDPLTIGSGSHTVEVWVKVPRGNTNGLGSTDRVGVILGSFSNINPANANWEIHDDGQMRVFWNNGQRNIFGSTDLRDDQWHHLAFVRDSSPGGEFSLYVDGAKETTSGTTTAGSDIMFVVPHRIGQDLRGSSPVAFHGSIDELTIHELALSAEQIKVRAGRFDQRGEGFNRLAFPIEDNWNTSPHLDLGAAESPVPELSSLTVTAVDDSSDSFDGQTSLREAIAFANSGDADGDGNLADAVDFDPSLAGRKIVLTGGQLTVTEPLTIEGDDQKIDAQRLSRVIQFTDTSGNLSLRNLHLTQGKVGGVSNAKGGAVRFDSTGTLMLERVRISESSAVGTNFAEGGGIYAKGGVTALSVTLDNNVARAGFSGYGGGIHANGTVSLSNATVFGNQVIGSGYNAYGGGVNADTINAISSTITRNVVSGVFPTGAGLFVDTSATITNSIVLKNVSPDNAEIAGFTASATLTGRNIIGESSGAIGSSLPFSGPVQVADAADVFANGNLQLTTDTSSSTPALIPTIALKESTTNLAIDGGIDSFSSSITVDASGNARLVDITSAGSVGDTIDLGAVELQHETRSTVVDTGFDEVDPFDLKTSLREAIAFANDRTVGEFGNGDADGSGNARDTILFAVGPGEFFEQQTTISLDHGELLITDDIIVLGPGEDLLTIDAESNSRVFNIASLSQQSDFYIHGVTLTGGQAGSNVGGAINLVDSATVLYPDDPGEPDAVDGVDQLFVFGVRMINNAANGGGAVSVVDAQYEILNSSLVSNNANFSGSAILAQNDSIGWIANTTISGNTSGSGVGAITVQAVPQTDGNLGIRNATIVNNVGNGIQSFAFNLGSTFITLGNTIIADNTSNNFFVAGAASTVVSLGKNLADDAMGGFNVPSDLINDDPMLDPIDMTASVLFHEAQVGSPVIDGGDQANARQHFGQVPLITDQRGDGTPLTGRKRTIDGDHNGSILTDIGAIEYQQLVVDTTHDADDGNLTAGNLSITEAVRVANDRAGQDEIKFDDSFFSVPRTISITKGLKITDSVSVVGTGADLVTLSRGNFDGSVIEIDDESNGELSDVLIAGVTISDAGDGTDNLTGGGILNFENLKLDAVTIRDNQAGNGTGGGIAHSLGDLQILNSTISNNSAGTSGGVRINSGTARIVNSTISGNSAEQSGGGLETVAETTILNSTITGNRADSDGVGGGTAGGVVASFDVLTMHNTIVAGNLRGIGGGETADDQFGSFFHPFSSNNLIGDAATSGGLSDGSFGNIVGNGGSGTIDTSTILDTTLAFNGGPTSTHALVPGSPAIDAGDNALAVDETANPLPTDQRGHPYRRDIDRNGDGIATVDVGAFEAQPEVFGRHIFYNNSSFDGNSPAASASDDGALAPHTLGLSVGEQHLGKDALLPGGTASFTNYTSYSRGINGIMIDVMGLANPGAINAADFQFFVGNSNDTCSWTAAPAPTSITVRTGDGASGSDRITIIWPDEDPSTSIREGISKQWLQVTVLVSPNTGLTSQDVHYWGNAIGEGGDSPSNAFVNATDEINARNNPHSFFSPAGISDAFDYNRDRFVNATDQIIARNNAASFFTSIKLISPASCGPMGSPLALGLQGEPDESVPPQGDVLHPHWGAMSAPNFQQSQPYRIEAGGGHSQPTTFAIEFAAQLDKAIVDIVNSEDHKFIDSQWSDNDRSTQPKRQHRTTDSAFEELLADNYFKSSF